MAGHSQFANIKHRKGAQDVKRAKIFTKLAREITVAAKLGLPDPDFNPRLRSAIIAAKRENLPKDRIESAIKSASGGGADENYEEVLYEAYGPDGTALMIHVLTNNRNRTASELRNILSKSGGSLVASGSVSFLFHHCGIIGYKSTAVDFEKLMNAAIESNAEDVIEVSVANEDDEIEKFYEAVCNAQNFGKIRDALYEIFGDAEYAHLSWKAQDLRLIDDNLNNKLTTLLENLTGNDDVQRVEHNVQLAS